jgi:hypothetical protein
MLAHGGRGRKTTGSPGRAGGSDPTVRAAIAMRAIGPLAAGHRGIRCSRKHDSRRMSAPALPSPNRVP